MNTIFSKIIKRELPADIVYEDTDLLAFHDISPQAPVHIIIIPKKEINTLNNLRKEDEIIVGKMVLLAKNLAKEFKINLSGYRTVFNCNEDGGQTVYHIHMHIMGGRQMKWPPG